MPNDSRHNKPQGLSVEEIENSIDLRPEVFVIIQDINSFSYLSEIHKCYRKLPRLAIDNELSEAEVNVIAAALEAKKFDLTAHDVGRIASEPQYATEDNWSPSDVLDKMPKNSRRDWAERAAKDREDKKD